jgi:hypothetical protein
MLTILQISTVILAALTMLPAVAHALELPGKKRLNKDAYFAVQRIYYPGFTIAGMMEPLAIVATVALIIVTPAGTDLWLAIVALIGLGAMHAVYWLVTHPMNHVWLSGEKLGGAGAGFFAIGSGGTAERRAGDWTALRDRWEHSHVARAALSSMAFVALVIAVSSVGD